MSTKYGDPLEVINFSCYPDPGTHSRSNSIFLTIVEWRILGDLLAFLIQSPADFCRAMLCKRGCSRHAVSVCLSRSWIRSKRINISLPSGTHTILVFPHQTAWRYYDGNPPNWGVECRLGRQKSQFWAYIWLQCLLLRLQQARCCQHGRRWTTASVQP